MGPDVSVIFLTGFAAGVILSYVAVWAISAHREATSEPVELEIPGIFTQADLEAAYDQGVRVERFRQHTGRDPETKPVRKPRVGRAAKKEQSES